MQNFMRDFKETMTKKMVLTLKKVEKNIFLFLFKHLNLNTAT